jgi:hypothetical protein
MARFLLNINVSQHRSAFKAGVVVWMGWLDLIGEAHMFIKKSIGIALALAMGASGVAFAAPTDIGGVMVDTNSPLDLNIQALNFRESSVANVGDILTGYGVIGSINGTNQSTFCPGCDLNFTFSYQVSSIDTTGANPQVEFDAGSIQFFVDNTSSFNVLNPATAGIGAPWLTLAGHTAAFTGFTGIAQLFATLFGTVADPNSGSTGIGYLDAVGGVAAAYFDTNTIDDALGGLADFKFNSAFLAQIIASCGATPSTDPTNVCHYPITGTATLLGDSKVPVPEPGAVGLLGFGLGVLGLFIWRRRKETDDRG